MRLFVFAFIAACSSPRMNDEPLVAVDRTESTTPPVSALTEMHASAEHEKARVVVDDCAEDEEGYTPCWCILQTINTPGGCANATELENNIQQFGRRPPRWYRLPVNY